MNRDVHWQQIADRYEPAWMPSPGELDDMIVVIDPVGGGAAESDTRRADDLALMTGLHLFHLVQAAGGVPVMTRADDRPLPNQRDNHGTEKAVSPLYPGADVVVSITFEPGGSTSAITGRRTRLTSFGNCALNQTLVRILVDALGADAGEEPHADFRAALFETGTCGATVFAKGPQINTASDAAAKLPRVCAEQLCKGLTRFASIEKGTLGARRDQRKSDRPPPTPVPRFVDTPSRQEIVVTARRLWPEGNLPVSKAAWFCATFRRVSLSDRTFVHFDPQVTVDRETVVIGGGTNIACMRDTLADALRALGIRSIRNEMRILPEEGQLGRDRFGACVACMALTYAEPSDTAGLQTQLLYGEPVLLLDTADDYLLIHAADGYWGWVRADSIQVITEEQFNRYASAERAVLLRDLERGNMCAPRGASLPVASTDGPRITLTQPDGAPLEVSPEAVQSPTPSDAASDRLRAALDLLHRPYLFGGIAPLGLDCSGLVRNVFGQTGMAMGRDAAQQFTQGRLVATRWHRANIRAGDLLFFINPCGRIFHVAIALSQTHYVHAAAPEVQITSLKKGDRLYNAAREQAFFAARRL